MTEHTNNPPNPGSMEALNLGCKCPIMDNHYGRGISFGHETVFWYNDDCKVHVS